MASETCSATLEWMPKHKNFEFQRRPRLERTEHEAQISPQRSIMTRKHRPVRSR